MMIAIMYWAPTTSQLLVNTLSMLSQQLSKYGSLYPFYRWMHWVSKRLRFFPKTVMPYWKFNPKSLWCQGSFSCHHKTIFNKSLLSVWISKLIIITKYIKLSLILCSNSCLIFSCFLWNSYQCLNISTI